MKRISNIPLVKSYSLPQCVRYGRVTKSLTSLRIALVDIEVMPNPLYIHNVQFKYRTSHKVTSFITNKILIKMSLGRKLLAEYMD